MNNLFIIVDLLVAAPNFNTIILEVENGWQTLSKIYSDFVVYSVNIRNKVLSYLKRLLLEIT